MGNPSFVESIRKDSLENCLHIAIVGTTPTEQELNLTTAAHRLSDSPRFLENLNRRAQLFGMKAVLGNF